MKRLITWSAAAALVVAAQQASAQAPSAAAPGSKTAASAKADPNAAATIQQIHATNARMIQVGKLAAERGTTPNTKQYGQRVAAEHERFDRELAQIAQKRGIQLQPADQITADKQHAANVQRIQSQQGLEFDRAVIDELARDAEGRVASLKQLRDRTPGSDAELKGWIDRTEVTMEKMRNEARDVRQAVRQDQQQQQRQGRKPQ